MQENIFKDEDPVNLTPKEKDISCSLCCGRTRLDSIYQKWQEMDIWPKSFCMVAITNYLCLTALAIEPLVESFMNEWQFNLTVVTRTLVFIVIIVFQNLHVFFGIFSENIYELYATMVTQFGAFVIIVLRSIFLPFPWDIYSLLLLIYAVFFQLVYTIYAIPLYRAYAWSFYKKAGTDIILLAKYRNVLLFHVFLKLDCMGSLINIMVFENGMDWKCRLGVSVICGIISIGYYILGRSAYTQESIPLVLSFWCLSLVVPVFIGFVIYRILKQRLFTLIDFPTISFGNYDMLVFSFLFVVSSVFLIFVRVLLIIQSIVVFRYFGEGIAQLVRKSSSYWEYDGGDLTESSENDSGGTVIKRYSHRENNIDRIEASEESGIAIPPIPKKRTSQQPSVDKLSDYGGQKKRSQDTLGLDVI